MTDRPQGRPLRLLDAMILVAAIAVAFGFVREAARKAEASGFSGYLLRIPTMDELGARLVPQDSLQPTTRMVPALSGRFVWIPLGDWANGPPASRIMGAWTAVGPCLLMATLVVLVLRYLPSSQRQALLGNEPGLLACAISCVALAITLAPSAWYAMRTGSGLWILDLFEYSVAFGPILASIWIVIAWSYQVWTRRWFLRSTWLESLGRILGVCHLAAGAFLAWYIFWR